MILLTFTLIDLYSTDTINCFIDMPCHIVKKINYDLNQFDKCKKEKLFYQSYSEDLVEINNLCQIKSDILEDEVSLLKKDKSIYSKKISIYSDSLNVLDNKNNNLKTQIAKERKIGGGVLIIILIIAIL